MTRWDTYAVCTSCDAKYQVADGRLFFAPVACHHCGLRSNHSVFDRGPKWPVKTMRYVSTAKLFSPSTWGSGRWEEREVG